MSVGNHDSTLIIVCSGLIAKIGKSMMERIRIFSSKALI